MPNQGDGVIHCQPGIDEEEKFLPSTLEDVEKRSHNIPCNPSCKAAKNVGFIVNCEECNKPCLLHAKHKLKANDIKGAKKMISTVALFSPSAWVQEMTKMRSCSKQFMLERIYHARAK